MLDQLKELLEMQKALDEALMKEHGKSEYPLEKTKIALFVELGEMMNELQTEFKWWKKTAKYDREKGLEEYVDCLHFALSLHNYYDSATFLTYDYNESYDDDSLIVNLYEIVGDLVEYPLHILRDLFVLGNHLGFTWEEIYSAYKKKNAVNYERLKNGY